VGWILTFTAEARAVQGVDFGLFFAQ